MQERAEEKKSVEVEGTYSLGRKRERGRLFNHRGKKAQLAPRCEVDGVSGGALGHEASPEPLPEPRPLRRCQPRGPHRR